MSAKIIDEFTNLPIPAYRKHWLRKRRDRKCKVCGQPLEEKDNLLCKLYSTKNIKQLQDKRREASMLLWLETLDIT